jgi:hypothetical protein
MKEFPKLIIYFNPDADETQYPYTAHLENCAGMVVQSTSKEGCVQQMLISIEVKMRHDAVGLNSKHLTP